MSSPAGLPPPPPGGGSPPPLNFLNARGVQGHWSRIPRESTKILSLDMESVAKIHRKEPNSSFGTISMRICHNALASMWISENFVDFPQSEGNPYGNPTEFHKIPTFQNDMEYTWNHEITQVYTPSKPF